jgi:hypothetical protein
LHSYRFKDFKTAYLRHLNIQKDKIGHLFRDGDDGLLTVSAAQTYALPSHANSIRTNSTGLPA